MNELELIKAIDRLENSIVVATLKGGESILDLEAEVSILKSKLLDLMQNKEG